MQEQARAEPMLENRGLGSVPGIPNYRMPKVCKLSTNLMPSAGHNSKQQKAIGLCHVLTASMCKYFQGCSSRSAEGSHQSWPWLRHLMPKTAGQLLQMRPQPSVRERYIVTCDLACTHLQLKIIVSLIRLGGQYQPRRRNIEAVQEAIPMFSILADRPDLCLPTRQ
eukprot:TRINITY_DN41532_c0_g1_i3.p2 TRINITY_DN41532_c0_g1~~TRINITY_DN41532_c0_g1_i3.p2  ORF type:complete len:166 (+),score=4.35 TRINITY_DN41532_c0_g1_i3:187-684(+)